MLQPPDSCRDNPESPLCAIDVARGVTRMLLRHDLVAMSEVPLDGNRRADLMAIDSRGQIVIVEVKSGPEDFKADFKWQEYRPYCDQFYFAVAPEFPQSLLPEEPGLIVADGFGGAVVREAAPAPLVPARRKALTLAFGRLTAMRAAALHL